MPFFLDQVASGLKDLSSSANPHSLVSLKSSSWPTVLCPIQYTTRVETCIIQYPSGMTEGELGRVCSVEFTTGVKNYETPNLSS